MAAIPLRNPDPLSKWEGVPERPLRPHERAAYEFGGELLCSGCDTPMSLGTCGCCETPDGLDADAYLALLDKGNRVFNRNERPVAREGDL